MASAVIRKGKDWNWNARLPARERLAGDGVDLAAHALSVMAKHPADEQVPCTIRCEPVAPRARS